MRGIEPYTREQGPKTFLTYDLEWIPGRMQVRCAGVYDGKRYRSYRGPDAMKRFLRKELSSANRGKVFYAHAGGTHDVQFVLETLVRSNAIEQYSVSAAMAGSSAIIVRIKQGKNVWTFCDSFWLLRGSLREIGASMGLEKGGGDGYLCPGTSGRTKVKLVPHTLNNKTKRVVYSRKEVYVGCGHEKGTCMFYAPIGELVDYNEQDCRILWEAIRRFETEVLELGGELKHTIASTALRLFRARFLKRAIHTSGVVNEHARESYTASRVEVFRDRAPNGGFSFDINSSFPHSMLEPAPGNLIRTNRSLTDGGLYLAKASVMVPDMAVPPIPYRHDGRVYFPTGTWDGWFMNTDLDYLQEKGGRVLGVERVYHFEPFTELGDYVSVVYELRRTETDPFRRLVYKYLLNSLYGKFAERSLKERILIRPESTKGLRRIVPGIFAELRDVKVNHTHVPVASHITALSRRLLTRYIDDAIATGGTVFYCDTDSVFTDVVMPTSDKLGGMKCEKEFASAVFMAPKLYRTDSNVKAKGFSKLNAGEFDTMAREVWDGVPFDERTPKAVNRMLRLKELWAKGKLSPEETTVLKRLALDDRPKRCAIGEGTRPWTVREIRDPWKGGR